MLRVIILLSAETDSIQALYPGYGMVLKTGVRALMFKIPFTLYKCNKTISESNSIMTATLDIKEILLLKSRQQIRTNILGKCGSSIKANGNKRVCCCNIMMAAFAFYYWTHTSTLVRSYRELAGEFVSLPSCEASLAGEYLIFSFCVSGVCFSLFIY